MKRRSLTVIIACFFSLIFYSCRNSCKQYALTAEEKSIAPYQHNQKIFFKNDSAGITDTLNVYTIGPEMYCQSCKCRETQTGLYVKLIFSSGYNRNFDIWVRHNQIPKVAGFPLAGTFQSITVNGTAYYDIYSVTVDSTGMNGNYKSLWKIEYSKTKGLVRAYYANGTTFSKM